MGNLFSALEIGRNGLLVSQAQLDTAGHNIANINKDGYSRQRVDITTRTPNYQSYGALGRGPAIQGVRRLREEFLDTVIRQQSADLGQVTSQSTFYSRIEDIFLEPSDQGFSTQLSTYFDTLNDFASNVEEVPVREALLSETSALAGSLNGVATRLSTMRTNANEEVRNLVPEINSLAEQISKSNAAIRKVEATGVQANDLRDDRDLMMDKLSELVKVTYRERENGEFEVVLGGEQLVNGSSFRKLEAVADATLDPDRPDLLQVQWTDSNRPAVIIGGELYGVLRMRDSILPEFQGNIDEIAQGLIRSVNQIHSQGRGLQPFDEPVRATNSWPSPATALNDPAADLPFTVKNGSFNIRVYNAAGAVMETVNVPITGAGPLPGQTTVSDVAAAINGSTNLTASLDVEGRITITPGSGMSFTFGDDTSGALTALGLNGLFQGTKASDIALSEQLRDHPEWITSGYSANLADTGDNDAALNMASLRNSLILDDNRQTADGYYQAMIVQVGIQTRDIEDTLAVEQAFAQDYQQRRETTSGVNMDEEATDLITFERVYQGCARVISIADRMLEILVNLGA